MRCARFVPWNGPSVPSSDAAGASQTFQDILAQLLESGRILLKLPRQLEQIITKLDTGQIEVKADVGLQHRSNRRGRPGSSRNNGSGEGASGLTSLLTFVASLGGGILLTNAHQAIAGWAFLGLAGLMGLLNRKQLEPGVYSRRAK